MTANAVRPDPGLDPGARSVTVRRLGPGVFAVSNERGAEITFGTGGESDFTPTELLLAAIGGCTSIDVDIVTTRRAEPDAFEVRVDAVKVRDGDGSHLVDITVTFNLRFPEGDGGDAARGVLPDIVRQSRERLCTVGRTIELGTPITDRIE